MLKIKAVEAELYAGEASLRNYLFTQDDRDQRAYRFHFKDQMAEEHLPVVRALTRQEPQVHKRVVALETLISNRIDLARALVGTLTNDGKEAAWKQLQADAGSPLILQINLLMKEIREEQNDLLLQRDKESCLAEQAMRWTIWVGLGANLLLLVLIGWLIADDIAARRRAMTALEEANAILEQKVRERTAELVKANEDLKKENLERQWSEQSLAHQLHYSDLIINSISDHIFVVSKANNISRVNPAVIHTTGYELHEVVGSRIDKLLSIQDPSDASQLRFAQALKEGRELQGRPAAVLCKNGATLPAQFNMIPLRDQNKVVGGVMTLRLHAAGDRKTG
jgi:PAS domain S-box-containing protein